MGNSSNVEMSKMSTVDERAIAGARDDQHTYRRVPAHLAQDVGQTLDHRAIQRVESLGPVNRDGRDDTFFKDQIFHDFSCVQYQMSGGGAVLIEPVPIETVAARC